MSRVRLERGEFEATIAGDGPPLVFIHGEIHGPEYFEHQLREFSRTHRCLAYARRGHAGTGALPGGLSLAAQTADLAALLDHFEMPRAALVAVAFGATIAANFAIEHRERVRSIAMVAWSELHDAPRYLDRWEQASKRVVEVLERDGRDALIDFLRREGGRSLYYVIPLDSPIREACVRMFASHPIEHYRSGMLEFARTVPDLVPRFKAQSIPVLGVCGELDPFPDVPEVLAGMKRFREAPMVPNAGRFVHWEEPEAFNALLAEFLAANP